MTTVLHLFAGDSHIRQFYGDHSGKYSITSFSGATIKGLANRKNGIMHGNDIAHMAASPTPKILYLMFGSVDIDATLNRKYALKEEFSFEAFTAERAKIYRDFVTGLLEANEASIRRLWILAPQTSPLRDAVFLEATAKMINLPLADLAAAGARHDLSLGARCARQVALNSALEAAMTGVSEKLRFARIDRDMLDEAGMTRPEFTRKNPKDHHPDKARTLALWREKLGAEAPF